MANKLTGPRSASDLTERRKELIFVDGYDCTAGLTVFTSDHNTNEVDVPVHGSDDNLTGVTTTSSNVSATILEQNVKPNGFLRLLHAMRPTNDPLDTPVKYDPQFIEEVDFLTMRKTNDDTSIVSSRLIRSVQLNPAQPEGGADDKSQRAYSGKGNPVIEVDGVITCDRVQSGENLRSSPQEVTPPDASGVYALHIVMLKFPGGDLSSKDVEREPIKTVTSSMVDSTGTVTWSALTAEVSLDTPDRAQIYYMTSGIEGIPETNSTIDPEGMRGDPIT